MPEGDTVWLAAQTMNQALASQLINRSDLRVPRLATVDLTGRTVLGVRSHGKHLFLRFDDDRTLHSHFRMDGSWHLYSPGVRWHGGPAWQIRALLSTEHVHAVGYRLPVVEMLDDAGVSALCNRLGPDLIIDDVDIVDAASRVRKEGQRPIGETLLDQRVVAGLGLIYVSESLFCEGLTPWLPVDQIEDVESLVQTASTLMRANRHHYIQTTTGQPQPDRWHFVFERAGRECWRCGTRIEVSWQCPPPHRRLAYWCPRCQQGPAPLPLSSAERRALRTTGRSRYKP